MDDKNKRRLSLDQKHDLFVELSNFWSFTEDHTKLHFKIKSKNFKQSLNFIKIISEIAEKMWHHPDISFGFGYLHIELSTHSVNDLCEQDFELAKKIDEILGKKSKV